MRNESMHRSEERYGILNVCSQENILSAYPDLVEKYLYAITKLADGILYGLSFAQQVVEPDKGRPDWCSQFGDSQRFLGLRCLVYPPGPLVDEKGEKVVTTVRHTDATWVTLVQQNEVCGLQFFSSVIGGWVDLHPVSGAFIVNTGNVLARNSISSKDGNPLFPAVCHRVIRDSNRRTRISMPFFYDRNGEKTGGC